MRRKEPGSFARKEHGNWGCNCVLCNAFERVCVDKLSEMLYFLRKGTKDRIAVLPGRVEVALAAHCRTYRYHIHPSAVV